MQFFFRHLIPTYRAFAKNGRVISFDTETTGLGSDDEIVQIAAIEYVRGIQSRIFSRYICPQMPMNESASLVNGITNEFLDTNGEDPKLVLSEFVDFVGANCLLVAHNISFDLRMLQQSFDRYGINGDGVRVLGCDTKDFVKSMNIRGLANNKLVTCVEHFALDAINSHEAFADADACGKLFFRIVEM